MRIFSKTVYRKSFIYLKENCLNIKIILYNAYALSSITFRLFEPNNFFSGNLGNNISYLSASYKVKNSLYLFNT